MTDDKEMKQYEKSEDITELGVYTKKETLDHKIELVRRMYEARENYNDPVDDDGNIYYGVYWDVNFSKFGMNLEDFIRWRDGITNYDSASMPMNVDYSGHLKKIWFASEGEWKGYFDIESVEGNKIFLKEWNYLESGYKRSSFQGYTKKVPKEYPDCEHYKKLIFGTDCNVCKGNDPYSCRRSQNEGLCHMGR